MMECVCLHKIPEMRTISLGTEAFFELEEYQRSEFLLLFIPVSLVIFAL